MSLNLASTMITLRQTLAPKNDPDFKLETIKIPMLPLHTSFAIHRDVMVEGG